VTRIGIIAASITLLVFFVWALWPRRVHRIKDTVASLEPRIALIMRSTDQRFLIIKVAGSEDFLQLTAAAHRAQIDFPLITDRQRALEERIREAAGELHLPFRETRGSDGSRFLDCDFTGTSHEVADACYRLLRRLFEVSDNTQLIFETDVNI
jgi:hypothetical protein